MRAWANETLFNVGLPKWRAVTKRLDRAGVVRIDCDVLHTWMSAAIVVTDSPYFAVSDSAAYSTSVVCPQDDTNWKSGMNDLGVRIQNMRVTESGA